MISERVEKKKNIGAKRNDKQNLVEQSSLGVADVQEAAGLGREARHHLTHLGVLQLDELALVRLLHAGLLALMMEGLNLTQQERSKQNR